MSAQQARREPRIVRETGPRAECHGARRPCGWAATKGPFSPAPMIATSVVVLMMGLRPRYQRRLFDSAMVTGLASDHKRIARLMTGAGTGEFATCDIVPMVERAPCSRRLLALGSRNANGRFPIYPVCAGGRFMHGKSWA